MADEIIIFAMVAISCFLMGVVVQAVLLQRNKPVNNTNIQREFDTKQIPPPVAKPKQQPLTTVCHKCQRKYVFYKSPTGKTKVECPFCHAKGIIG
jgi:hypothetical protein